jgi:transcription elongation factor GreA-like protein
MSERLVPGQRVRHPLEPGWGVGQVQSVIGDRVTVNFEHAGKLLINAAVVRLEPVKDDPAQDDRPGH